jgi:hypothetical protein
MRQAAAPTFLKKQTRRSAKPDGQLACAQAVNMGAWAGFNQVQPDHLASVGVCMKSLL